MRPSHLGVALVLVSFAAQANDLRICADPNNLPFSNRAHQGFEDRIAALAAHDLHVTLHYTYVLENERFLARTVDAGKCDIVMGVPASLSKLDTTRPYYTSTYVFVSRKSGGVKVGSFTDLRLRKLRIGVHLIGDESSPPALALGEEGIVDNVRGYIIEQNFARPNPPARLIEAVENGEIDVAAVWGPFAGYFARSSAVPLSITRDEVRFAPLKFRFSIAIGVRKGDTTLRSQLDGFIARENPVIHEILEEYGLPLVNTHGDSHG